MSEPSNAAGPGHKGRARSETPTATKSDTDATDPIGRVADIVATAAPMTKAERAELQRVVRLHAKVARDDVDALKAERLAELEAELSAKYPPDDPRWQTITAEADRPFGELDGRLAELCAAEGLRPEFRPRLYMEWYPAARTRMPSAGPSSASSARPRLRPRPERPAPLSNGGRPQRRPTSWRRG